MALTPFTRNALGAVRVLAEASPDLKIPLVGARAVYNTAVEEQAVSEASLRVVELTDVDLNLTQTVLRVLYRGKIENPRLRTWAYTLDGHDFYVLKLGTEDNTLVLDVTTKQWSHWSSGDTPRWRASTGLNWRTAKTIPNFYGSNVIVGDDSYGALWVLDPEYGLDEAMITGDPVPYPRVAMGQLPLKGRSAVPCFSVYLSASVGAPLTEAANVSLSYSDDSGQTFVEAGTYALEAANYNQELAWRSLGQIRNPGRLFKISDDGALARIDALNVNNEND